MNLHVSPDIRCPAQYLSANGAWFDLFRYYDNKYLLETLAIRMQERTEGWPVELVFLLLERLAGIEQY